MSESDFKEIDNPYIVGNPVKSKDMFFGRDETFRDIKNAIIMDGSHVILLVGGRRSGKTSILMQIKNGRIKDVCEPVLCDFHEIVAKIKNDEDLPRLIGDCIIKNKKFESFKTSFYGNNSITYNERLQILITNCIEKIKPKKLILLCDEFDNLEKSFDKKDLSSNAIRWVKTVLNKDIFFIMTSSQALRNNYVRSVFAHNSEFKNISVLSRSDTYSLIEKPVKNYLDYEKNSLKDIYRLSGGQPFFTQYICQILITDVNYRLKRNYILSEDLPAVVSAFIDSPPGHMIETWRYLCDPRNAPTYTAYVLSALAITIKNKEQYIDINELLKTSKLKRFIFNELQLRESLAWLKNYGLLDSKRENYRFKFDLLRHWISSYYETGDDVTLFINENIAKDLEDSYTDKFKLILKHTKNNKISDIDKKELVSLSEKFLFSKEKSISIMNNEIYDNKSLVPIDIDIIDIDIEDIFPPPPPPPPPPVNVKKIFTSIAGILMISLLAYFIYLYFSANCNKDSSKLEDGINCFSNGDLIASKNIFSNIIKKQENNITSSIDLDEILKPYVYLAFISIENSEESIEKIKSIYFSHPNINIDKYEGISYKYMEKFNKAKDKLKINNEKVKDIITQSNFIYICINNCKNNRNNKGFWIGEKEVSEKLWYKFSSEKIDDINDSPIKNITWEESNNFSLMVKKRLCKREEWINAFQKGENTGYVKNSIIKFIGNNRIIPASPSSINKGEVGTTGIYNLVGNVSEFITIQGEPSVIGLNWEEMIFNEDDIISKIIKDRVYLEKKSSKNTIGIRLCYSH